MKWLLTVVILIVGWTISALLRGVTKRLGRRREYTRARIFQTAVVINAACLVKGDRGKVNLILKR